MRTRHFILPLVLAALLAACSPTVPAMTPEETQRINELTAKMTTRCVGRYLIDLPEQFVLNSIETVRLEGVKITVTPMTRAKFDYNLHYREEALRKMHMDGKPDKPFLRSITPLPEDASETGKIFNRAKDTGTAGIVRTLELFAFRKGYFLQMEINSTDYKGAGLDRPDDPPNDTPQKLAHLLKIYERLQGRADTEVPTGQGICFPNGFLSGPATDEEQVDQYYHLSTVEDVYFGFHYLSDIGPEKTTLLERGKAIDESLAQNKGKTLRKGKRQANGLDFEEWLSMQETDHGVMDYDLTLEMNSKHGNAMKPLLVVDYASGVEHPGPSLSLEEAAVHKPIAKATFGDAESMAIWDKVTATLRPRPGAF